MAKFPKFSSPLLGWMAMVVIPFAIFITLAIFGIQAQKNKARLQIQKEAEVISATQAELLSQQLRSLIKETPQISVTPPPGEASVLDSILESSDITALEQLRDEENAGFSSSGLPRRALAALRIDYLSPGTQPPDQLVQLFTVEAPSLLTLPALKRIKDRDPNFSPPEGWQLIDRLGELLKTNPDGGWVRIQNRFWWISADGNRYLPPSALTPQKLELPSFATARFSTNRLPLTGPFDGELITSNPIDFPSPLTLDWVLTDPEIIDDLASQQTRWTLALFAISLLISCFGIFAIIQKVREERRLSRLKGQFVASVSHELRAPIGSIRLMADALEAGRSETPREMHRLISRESERLSHLIENVLDFARIEEGKRHYQFEEYQLDELIKETAQLFSTQAVETGHTIEQSLTPGRATVDRGALQQAAANLLDNALKFSPPNTPILISLSWHESSWSLQVSNQGPEIPEAERLRIFERFHRLGDELRRETKGTGIGLSLVQHIAQAHKGTVSVTNDPTTFTLTAPIHPTSSS